MDTATQFYIFQMLLSNVCACVGKKKKEKHEGSSNAGNCSLSMHLGEYSHSKSKHEPHRVQSGDETCW